MYSSQVSAYQKHIRAAFENLLLSHNVDAYFNGHIHWYERIYPVGNSVINHAAVVNNNTYITGNGTSMVHICNGFAGNIEYASTINASLINTTLTYYLNQVNYGLSRIQVINSTTLLYQYIIGSNGTVGDQVYLVKP